MMILRNSILFLMAICLMSSIYLLSDILLFDHAGFLPAITSSIILKNIIIGLSTFLGIASRHLLKKLEKEKSQINIIDVLKNFFKTKDLWISIIICPVILVTVFKSVEQVPDNLLAYLFAYQNGFFFNSIISGIQND